MTTKLFVYGTLRSGHANSRMFGLEGVAPCIPQVKLEGFELFELGAFPGIRPGEGSVIGDLFDVRDDQWAGLDQYEGVPSLYTRETVSVGGFEGVQVYVYHKAIPADKKIVTGDWFNKEAA